MKRIAFVLALFGAVVGAALPLPAAGMPVTDMANRAVAVPIDPDRIVCIGPGALRLIVYLQAQDKVVGVEDMEKMNPGGRPYWIAHPELSSLPRCGPGGPASINKKPDMEAVLAVRPQVVFITYMDGPLAETVQNRLGIPVIVLDYGAFATFDETVFDALELAGRILNREKRAKQVVNYINALRGDLKRRTAGIAEERKPGVYVGGLGYRGAHGIGSSDHRYVPFEWLDARNLAVQVEASVGSHVSVGEETLLKLDPDVVFIDGGGLQLVETDYRKKRSFYQALRAFSSGRVYTLLPFNWYTTNIGTALADAYAIGKVLYPDRFEDIDPAQKADEIYSFLVGETVYRAMEADYGPIGGRAPFLR